MKTKFIINIQANIISYPIGQDIVRNKSKIEALVESFKSIEEFKNQNITLVCMGSSGAIIATIFSMLLPEYNTSILHIKKQGENSHDNSVFISLNSKIVIVDDFISSGSTMNKIYESIFKKEIDCVCVTGLSFHDLLNFEPNYFICALNKKRNETL